MMMMMMMMMFKMAEFGKWQPLPPIEQSFTVGDRYAKSKLMTYTRSRERQKMLNNIMLVPLIFF